MKFVLFFLLLVGLAFGAETEAKKDDVPEWKKMLETAIEQASKGDIDEAVASVQKSLAIEDHHTGHHLLSQLYLAKQDPHKSLEEMKKAYELDKTNPIFKAGVKFHSGIIEQLNGNAVSAKKMFVEAAETTDKMNVKELEKTAIALASLGDLPLAINYLREIWKLEPHHKFHNNLPFVKIVDLYDEMASLAEVEGGDEALKRLNTDLANITKVTNKIYFDVAVADAPAQRVEIGLYGFASPKAVANLVAMASCKTEKLCYKNTKFHRIIKDFIVQGGDVEKGDGSGIRNIYDRPYSDDVFALALMHDRAGVVQVANAGPNQNGGQFVILCGAAPHLNGNHVIVGKVLSGLDTVLDANKVETDEATGKPKKDVLIKDCGVLSA